MKKILTWMALTFLMGSSVHAQGVSPKDWQHTVGLSAEEARTQWKQITAGEELAQGKKVSFIPSPNYGLTTDDNDPYDLTDGSLSSRTDDRIWFNSDAVGWSNLETPSKAWMSIDLGSEQPIGQIAIRIQAGWEQRGLGLPSSVEFLVSNNGKDYYSLHEMARLNAKVKLSKHVSGIHVVEDGKAFMVPLVYKTAVNARYVALRMNPYKYLFIDQISILKAENDVPLKEVEEFPKTQVYIDDVIVIPRHQKLVITTNIVTPNFLSVLNPSGIKPAGNKVTFQLKLPKELQVLPISELDFEKVSSDVKATTYKFSYSGRDIFGFNKKTGNGSIGPIWIEKAPGSTIPADAAMTITTTIQGKTSSIMRYPIKFVEIPEVSEISGLDISLAWMHEDTQRAWPNFLRDFRKMGFDYISLFPRYYERHDSTQENLAFIKQARNAGYGVLYNESPFHEMWNKVQRDLRNGEIDESEAKQLFTLIDGKQGKWMNILYRGKYFQDEVARVAKLAKLVQPDHLYMDIEWWGPSVRESKKDPRVVAVWKASGKSWDNFVADVGQEVMRTLVSAVRQAVPEKELVIGSYNVNPKHAIFQGMLGWKRLYPNILDIAQPELYLGGKVQAVADYIRFDYNAMQAKQIIPWLTAGTFGEFSPHLMEPMVLETILNGARGLTYYWSGDFDPMDFYYHSKALAELEPYEKLLNDGKPIAYKGDNPSLHYTAFASDNEALLLVANYNGVLDGNVKLPLPINGITKVLLDGKSLPIDNNCISLNLPPGEFRLIYLAK